MANEKQKINGFLKYKFNLKQRVNLYKRLKSFIEEQFPVYDSLVKFKLRFEKRKDFKAKVIDLWLVKMQNGSSFSEAIEGWVPDAELNLITAGEEGGGLENGLGEAIKFAESSMRIKSAVINGSIYPVVLLVVIIGFIALFSVQLAPTYLKILPLSMWPDMGQRLYAVSKFIINDWWVVLSVISVTTVVITKTMGNWTGPVREIFDKFPPWSIYKTYHSSSFLISLSSMMKSGTPLNDGLKRIKAVSSKWVSVYVAEMMKNLKKGGKNFGKHLDVGLLDEEVAGDVIDYSELGKFEEAIYSIGEKSLEESVEKINAKMGLFKNLMIVMVGAVVMTIYYTTNELNGAVAEKASSSTSSTTGGRS